MAVALCYHGRTKEVRMGKIAWTETLAEATARAADEGQLLLTYLFAPG